MRSISLRRPSAAMVVSCVALFSALGGSSYAAAKLTSSGIANHTIRGVDVHKHTLGPKTIKLDSLGGDQINEAALGTVPSADTLDGVDSAGFMKSMPRLYEKTAPGADNFVSGVPLVTLEDVPAGSYVVTAKLVYKNDGIVGEPETCWLDLPGLNDVVNSRPVYADEMTFQKVVTAAAGFEPTLKCSGDGNDDARNLSIIATRLD